MNLLKAFRRKYLIRPICWEPCDHKDEWIFWNPYNKVIQCHLCGHIFWQPITFYLHRHKYKGWIKFLYTIYEQSSLFVNLTETYSDNELLEMIDEVE